MERCYHGDTIFTMKQEAVLGELEILKNSQNLANTSKNRHLNVVEGFACP